MKIEFALCVLAATFACLQATPLRTSWYDLLPATTLEKGGVGDIWSDCSKSGDPVKIDSVTITPDPPVKGKNVSIKATFTLSEQVTKGNVAVKAKYGIIPVYSGNLDLCTLGQEAGLPCPVAAGDHTVTLNEAIPSAIPSGHYTGSAEVTDQNGNELACIDFDLHF